MKLHVGKKNEFCPTLKVHGTDMPVVSEVTYLGDILSSAGKNAKNIKDSNPTHATPHQSKQNRTK